MKRTNRIQILISTCVLLVLTSMLISRTGGADFTESGFILILRGSDSCSECPDKDTGIIVYNVFWIDHDFRDEYPEPMAIAGGELKAGGRKVLDNGYKPGEYVVIWFAHEDKEEREPIFFTVRPGQKVVLVTPERAMVGGI